MENEKYSGLPICENISMLKLRLTRYLNKRVVKQIINLTLEKLKIIKRRTTIPL